jgi:hypothetical protein
LTQGFPKPEAKVFVYLHSVTMAKRANHDVLAATLLDSAAHLAATIDEPTLPPWYYYSDRFNFAANYLDDKDARSQAEDMLRSTPENLRVAVYNQRVAALALRDDLYDALHSLPENFTEAQDLDFRTQMLLMAAMLTNRQNTSELGLIIQEQYFTQRMYVFFFGQNI